MQYSFYGVIIVCILIVFLLYRGIENAIDENDYLVKTARRDSNDCLAKYSTKKCETSDS